MSDLKQKLLAAVAFDMEALTVRWPRLQNAISSGGLRHAYFVGNRHENARLTPLLTALIDVACAAEKHQTTWALPAIDKALAALADAVGEA